jgi:hypothetical protein
MVSSMDVGIMNAKEMLPNENFETDMLTSLPFYEVTQNHVPNSYKNTYEPAYVQEICLLQAQSLQCS